MSERERVREVSKRESKRVRETETETETETERAKKDVPDRFITQSG